MANAFTYQIIKDTTEHAVIKLTGKFDGSGQESNTSRVQANTLSGALNANTPPTLLSTGGSAKPYYGLSINRVWYDCMNDGTVELFWSASDTPATIMFLNGNSEFDGAGNWTTIPNNAGANASGNIGFTTTGMVANSAYTIILEVRKHNEYYQRGQFNDPAAFNYPPYGLTP
jgi:hypothetical protein